MKLTLNKILSKVRRKKKQGTPVKKGKSEEERKSALEENILSSSTANETKESENPFLGKEITYTKPNISRNYIPGVATNSSIEVIEGHKVEIQIHEEPESEPKEPELRDEKAVDEELTPSKQAESATDIGDSSDPIVEDDAPKIAPEVLAESPEKPIQASTEEVVGVESITQTEEAEVPPSPEKEKEEVTEKVEQETSDEKSMELEPQPQAPPESEPEPEPATIEPKKVVSAVARMTSLLEKGERTDEEKEWVGKKIDLMKTKSAGSATLAPKKLDMSRFDMFKQK